MFAINIVILVNVQVCGKNGNMYSMVGPFPLELKTGKTTFSAEHKGQVMALTCTVSCDFYCVNE